MSRGRGGPTRRGAVAGRARSAQGEGEGAPRWGKRLHAASEWGVVSLAASADTFDRRRS